MNEDINYGVITGTLISEPKYENKNNFPNLYLTIKSHGYFNPKTGKQLENIVDIGLQGKYADSMKSVLKSGQSVCVKYYLKYSSWFSVDKTTNESTEKHKVFIVGDNVVVNNQYQGDRF